tara:strand:+ start:3564 stop:3806 length:243 start_codon:yes stop_codon:yes gene_type:complete
MPVLNIKIDGAPGMEATREANIRNATSEAVWETIGEMLSECPLSEMLDGITISFELKGGLFKGGKIPVGEAFLPGAGGAD